MLTFNAPTVSANGGGSFSKLIDTTTYDATGVLIGPIGDNILYICRQSAVADGSDGKLSKATYTISTNTWSSFTEIYDSEYDDLQPSGGIIDNAPYSSFLCIALNLLRLSIWAT